MHPPIAILATDALLVARGPGSKLSLLLRSPGGVAGSCAAPRIAEAAILRCRLPAVARCAQRLPAAAIPEHGLVTVMRIDMINDACRADQIVTRAFHAQRMIVQEGGAFRSPSIRAIERAGQRITLASVVPIALPLFAPANRAMERRTNGHDADLVDNADDGDGSTGNDNARDGFHRRARCSPEHIQNLPQTSRFCPFENCPPNKVLPGSHACDAQASSITFRFDRLRLSRRRLSFRAMRHSA